MENEEIAVKGIEVLEHFINHVMQTTPVVANMEQSLNICNAFYEVQMIVERYGEVMPVIESLKIELASLRAEIGKPNGDTGSTSEN